MRIPVSRSVRHYTAPSLIFPPFACSHSHKGPQLPNSMRGAKNRRPAFPCPSILLSISVFSSSSRIPLVFTYFASMAPKRHLFFLDGRQSSSTFISQAMPLTFLVLFTFEFFTCGKGADLFFDYILVTSSVNCKMFFIPMGSKGPRTTSPGILPCPHPPIFSHHDLDSLNLSPLLVSFMSLLHNYFTIIPGAQGEMRKCSQRE